MNPLRILFLGAILMATNSPAAVTIEKTPYAGWPNCYRMTNGDVELIVTTDVGPRVIRYGFPGGQNMFKEFKEQLGHSGEAGWQARGGHRLWVGPEAVPMSYALDNVPVQVVLGADTIELTEPVEKDTGFQKTMRIRLAATGSDVEVVHRIKNTNDSARKIASWGLTMMAQGGTAVAGFPPRGTHPQMLLPTNPLVMWGYTNFSDPRWTLTEKYLVLRQDPKATTPVKAGLWNKNTWEAYLLGSDLFIKSTPALAGPEAYPDMGCSLETFTNADFLEMETLGPLDSVAPGQTIGHTEHWTLHKNVHVAKWTDDEIDRAVAPK
jgi:hypothetical protein